MNGHLLTKEEQLLFKEYELRAGQMRHEDKLRHQLIKFIITLSTAVIGGLVYLSKDDFLCPVQYNEIVILCSLLIIIISFSVIIIAKIRKAQLLSMKICDNIRGYFYKKDYMYKINILSPFTFPIEPNYPNPSQTLWFVYLLSLFNSCLFFYLLIVIWDICLLKAILYVIFSIWFFKLHIFLYEYYVKPN